jgi:hypothetical protein
MNEKGLEEMREEHAKFMSGDIPSHSATGEASGTLPAVGPGAGTPPEG